MRMRAKQARRWAAGAALACGGGAAMLAYPGCLGGASHQAVSTDALTPADPDAESFEGSGLRAASGPASTVAGDPEAAARFAELRALHLRAVAGDDPAYEASRDGFEALRADHPADARLAAWMGSSLLLGAREALLPTTKLALASQGVPLLNAAARAAPSDPVVRWLRGVSTVNLPRIGAGAEAAARGEADLAWVYERIEPALAAGLLTPQQAASTAYNHGRMLERVGDEDAARGAYERAVELAPSSRSAGLAREAMAGDAG
ncbi:MAG: hypothetical protein AAGA57_04265 [Planctomycetota bacterium]